MNLLQAVVIDFITGICDADKMIYRTHRTIGSVLDAYEQVKDLEEF